MKNILKALIILMAPALMSGCIKEVFPQDGTVTADQARASLESAVLGLHGWMNKLDVLGYGADDLFHFDFGYPSIIIQNDAMGQDVTRPGSYNHFSNWQFVSYQGEDYLSPAMRWAWYYKLITMCNTIIGLYPDPLEAGEVNMPLVGMAYAYRAFAYFDLGRWYLPGTYMENPDGPTVPLVTDETSADEMKDNPRAEAHLIFDQVLSDLKTAEACLEDYSRSDKNLPDLSVVQGLLARYYLETGEWAEAERYAKAAQASYTPLTEAQWSDHTTGFNTPNAAWMWCCSTTTNDDVVQTGIVNWASWMSIEAGGYAAYNKGPNIDAHLYSLIPTTDFRKKSWVNLTQNIIDSSLPATAFSNYSSVKFRPGNGNMDDILVGASVSVPLMRVEEMKLIEAEAAGRLTLANGKQLLEDFVKTRNPVYVSEATTTEEFIDEVWLQRRIELWGEGFSTLDLKRLDKPVIRSYTGTNHVENYRFNTVGTPEWLTLVISISEIRGNDAITTATNNPDPSQVSGNDPDPAW